MALKTAPMNLILLNIAVNDNRRTFSFFRLPISNFAVFSPGKVLLIDSRYKTNRFDFSMTHVVESQSRTQTLSFAYCLCLRNVREYVFGRSGTYNMCLLHLCRYQRRLSTIVDSYRQNFCRLICRRQQRRIPLVQVIHQQK